MLPALCRRGGAGGRPIGERARKEARQKKRRARSGAAGAALRSSGPRKRCRSSALCCPGRSGSGRFSMCWLRQL